MVPILQNTFPMGRMTLVLGLSGPLTGLDNVPSMLVALIV